MNETEIKEFISDIQGGGDRIWLMRNAFPDDMKGSMAKQFWDDPTFTYGIEYGALIILYHILEVRCLQGSANK